MGAPRTTPPLRAALAAVALVAAVAVAACEPEDGRVVTGAGSASAATSATRSGATTAGPSSSGVSSPGADPVASPATGPAPASTSGGPDTPSAQGPAETPSARGTTPQPATGGSRSGQGLQGRTYPLHTGIVATTFWVGEVFDPDADDGSQVYSTYDDHWQESYGGCDGRVVAGRCSTEKRTAANGFFPAAMTPRQNPFYLDLPFDDVNDPSAAAQRSRVVPWAHDAALAGALSDPDRSIMKNRWVAVRKGASTCYGQVQDAGPGEYDDAAYVFGHDDARPRNTRYNGAGMDVSPALNGCLGFAELDGEDDRVDWWFVDDVDVPPGPWLRLVTRS